MKKKHIYFVLLVWLVIFAMLAACGSGEPLELVVGTPEYAQIDDSRTSLTGDGSGGYDVSYIKKCIEDANNESNQCPSSSSAEELPSSSSYDDDPPPQESSSSEEPYDPGQPSSSSTPGTTPSSSSTTPQQPSSSSSVDGNAYVVPAFTCRWDPASVYSGEETEIKIDIDVPSGINCTKSAYVDITNILGNASGSVYNFPVSPTKITPKFGDVLQAASGNLSVVKWPDEPTQSGGTATYTVKGKAVCSGNGQSNGERTEDCTLTIRRPGDPNVSGTITWTNGSSSSGKTIFSSGETPAYTRVVTIADDDNGKLCGNVEYKESWSAPLVAGTTEQTIKVEAVCSSTGSVLRTAEATVVPNPSLGTCTWKENPIIKDNEAVPSVTVSNDYGRCQSPTYSGGFPKVVTEADVGTISNVTATLSCSTGNITQTCEALEILSAQYTINGKGSANGLSLPAGEKILVKVNIPSSNWQYNNAYVTGSISNLSSGTCTVTVTPKLPSGCSGVTSATLSGTNYLGRESIGKPTCDSFELELDIGANCNSLTFNID